MHISLKNRRGWHRLTLEIWNLIECVTFVEFILIYIRIRHSLVVCGPTYPFNVAVGEQAFQDHTTVHCLRHLVVAVRPYVRQPARRRVVDVNDGSFVQA